MLAMQRAVEGPSVTPRLALIDGNRCPELAVPCAPVVKGDSQVPSDRCGVDPGHRSVATGKWSRLDRVYPGYGMAGHERDIRPRSISRRFPASARRRIHRRSFAPVRELLDVSVQ